jgi:hypothetical protein
MTPLIPLVAGLVALVCGWLVLRSFGSNYRVGRLLATTPRVSVAEARVLAAGSPRYVRVDGRVDSETDFEDHAHRPLVFRRTRLQFRRGRGWQTFEDGRERVDFEIREALDSIAVDDTALDTGLVVVPRESIGKAADIGDRAPDGTPPTATVRAWIEQVSSVEQAVVLGVPSLDASGAPCMSAGLGRPLVLTTLEPSEAMRLLAGSGPRRPAVALACFAVGLGLVAVGLVVAAVGAIG